MSEAEKAAIVARLELEQTIRATLAEKTKQGTSRWQLLNSGIGLLVVGFLLTGILVPIFQYTSKIFESRRLDRFETLTARIQVMRESHRDLVGTSVSPSEAYERVKPFLSPLSIKEKDLSEYRKEMFEINARRFAQNARVSASLAHFDEAIRSKATEVAERYFGLQTAFFSTLDNIAIRRYCNKFASQCGSDISFPALEREPGTVLLDKEILAMNKEYATLEELMINEIRRMENERAHFWF